MPATARSVRSDSHHNNATRPVRSTKAATRPQLHVVKGSRDEQAGMTERFGRVIEWTRSRTAPLLQITVAIAFLAATLLGALVLRTQMVENSFEASTIESNITVLKQDVQEAQAELDALEASLPDLAEEMGMEPQEGSISIDLSEYQADKGE